MQPDLIASGSLFARIFNASPVAMGIFARADGRCVAANEAFGQLFGYSLAELIGRGTNEVGLIDAETWRHIGQTVLESGQMADRPLRVRARDGSIHDVLVSVQSTEWAGEAYFIALVQDLTDYNRARQALTDAEARFRLFFESIPLPVVVYDCDSLAILDVNAITLNQYGYARDELLGRSVLELWPPDDRLAQASALRADNAPAGPACHNRADGTLIEVEATSQPINLGGGCACLSIFADVTEQRATEAARRSSEEQLRIIADVTNDVLWDFDLDRQTAVYSSGMSALFGHEAGPRPAPGWWLSQIHPDDRDRVRHELQAAIPSYGGRWVSQYRFRRADGSYAHVLDRGYALRDTSGGISVVGAMVDITRQIELKEAAARATLQERQRLARDLHDAVTQSVYSLTLMTEAARRRAALGEQAAAFDYVDRLSELARQALKEMRLLVYELRPAALTDEPLVTALQSRLDAVEQRAGVQARLRVDAQPHLPAAIETQLFHIVEEALNNTLKHAAATAVEVIIGGDERRVLLEIRDNGVGFQPEVTALPGGLGLVSMRERVDNLGGTFEVQTYPGKGTTVRVSLELRNGENGKNDPHSDL